MERLPQIKSLDTDQLVSLVRDVGIDVTRVENLDKVDVSGGVLNIATTLCPLYTKSDMNNSELLNHSQNIQDSRVASKFEAGLNFLDVVKTQAERNEISVHCNFVFANRGVICANPSDVQRELLYHHEEVYRRAIEEELGLLGVSWDLRSYSDITPKDFPRFFSAETRGKLSNEGNDLTDSLYNELKEVVLFDESVINSETGQLNRRGRKIVNSLVDNFGPDLARDFIMQYGIFDAIITRPDSLNVYYERGELLLNITNLFAHKRNPRLDILC